MATLVLLRHGQSTANATTVFAGWLDVGLTDLGRHEARAAGRQLRVDAQIPDVVHTSVLSRAVETAALVAGQSGVPGVAVRQSWRLNERHYGALQGRTRADAEQRYGHAAVANWRRSWDTAPPAGLQTVPDGPVTESLADVSARLLPYWFGQIVPDLREGRRVLVVSHGNAIRVLVKHLDGVAEDGLESIVVPTAVGLRYELCLDDLGGLAGRESAVG